MSEAVFPSSVGSRLRAAREAQGLSVEEAAGRLRLMHRQIDAMECEDFESLGQPVFARGFVRNYARLLGLDPETLLADMAGAPADSAPVVQHAAPPPAERSTVSPWLLLLLLGLLLAAAVPVGLYWWLNSDVEEHDPAVSAPPASVLASAAARQTGQPAAPPAEAPAIVPAEATPAVEAEKPDDPVAQGTLLLEFGDESWVEIKDAGGRMLLRKLNQPGSHVELKGQPPFDLVIGNAAQVRLSYNGRPIDMKPFIGVTVARFTLEE
ncbi:MAG: helix-turn-helix domain-containing protein [Thiobacillus sp.]|nr:helix-turn-helix domain-containing protein [Thiobacillus sp.]